MTFQISEEKAFQFKIGTEIIWKYIVKIDLLITPFYLKYHKYGICGIYIIYLNGR